MALPSQSDPEPDRRQPASEPQAQSAPTETAPTRAGQSDAGQSDAGKPDAGPSDPVPTEPTPSTPPRDWRRTAKTATYVTLAVVITIFLLRNSQSVEVDFVVASVDVPLFLVLLGTLILGAVLALGITGLRRHRTAKRRKRARRAQQDEPKPEGDAG